MAAGKYPIVVTHDAGWTRGMTLEDENGNPRPLAGYAGHFMVRDPEGEGYVLELTEADGITFTDVSPNIVITITRAQVNELTLRDSAYRFDIGPDSESVEPFLKDTFRKEQF